VNLAVAARPEYAKKASWAARWAPLRTKTTQNFENYYLAFQTLPRAHFNCKKIDDTAYRRLGKVLPGIFECQAEH
jgi:hypothetical protein